MRIHGRARRPAHLRSSHAPPLRIEPDHPAPNDDPPRSKPACGIPLPASVPIRPRKRSHDLRTSAARIEPARLASFLAAARSRFRAYPPRIATRLADCDLDLLEERLRPRIDTCSTVAGPARSDRKIFALITCHDATIDIGKSRHKSCRASIASNRIDAHDDEEQRGSSSTHIASAIAWKIEIKNENSKVGTCTPCSVPSKPHRKLRKPMCRHTLATKGSQRTPVRFSRRSRLSSSTFARLPKWILSENQAATNAQNIDRKSSGRSCNHTANESYYCLSRSSTTLSSMRESSDDKRIAPGVSRATIHANRSQPTSAPFTKSRTARS
jgi:hypothetical protein